MPKGDNVAFEIASSWSCDEQLQFAKRIAANIGYKLVPEDSIQDAEDRGDMLSRIERLESAVLELNPGLNWPR